MRLLGFLALCLLEIGTLPIEPALRKRGQS